MIVVPQSRRLAQNSDSETFPSLSRPRRQDWPFPIGEDVLLPPDVSYQDIHTAHSMFGPFFVKKVEQLPLRGICQGFKNFILEFIICNHMDAHQV